MDASDSVLVIYQEHGYGYVPRARGKRCDGPEGDRNRSLLGFNERAFTLDDATHRLTPTGLARNRHTLRRRIYHEAVLHPWALPLYRPVRRTVQRVRKVLQDT